MPGEAHRPAGKSTGARRELRSPPFASGRLLPLGSGQRSGSFRRHVAERIAHVVFQTLMVVAVNLDLVAVASVACGDECGHRARVDHREEDATIRESAREASGFHAETFPAASRPAPDVYPLSRAETGDGSPSRLGGRVTAA